MSALEIAKKVITCCLENGTPISNLQLQKILYYIQGNFLARFNQPAFPDEINAWKHGPVVVDVYYAYNKYVARKIDKTDEAEINLGPDQISLIERIALEKAKKSAWDLVTDTHKERPWKETYTSSGDGSIIPKSLIEEYFKSLPLQ